MNETLMIGAIAVAASLIGFVITGKLIDVAPRLRLIDSPNVRSSHTRPTPRGGGIAIVVAFSVAAALATALGYVATRDLLALLLPGWAVAAVGFIDDRGGVRPGVRLVVHLGAAVAFLLATHGVPETGVQWVDGNRAVGFAVGVLAITWSINFFNFMDGIDGIAASEAAFVCVALAFIAAVSGQPGVLAAAVGLAFAAAGFLAWNWPPARIFLGDVGSGFLGFVLAALAMLALRSPAVNVWTLVLLPGAFLADATVTLVRRALRRERVQEAHRSHAYQWLARRWSSHRRVTLLYVAVNLLIVAPAAALTLQRPALAGIAAAVVLSCLAGLAAIAGAGRQERPPRN